MGMVDWTLTRVHGSTVDQGGYPFDFLIWALCFKMDDTGGLGGQTAANGGYAAAAAAGARRRSAGTALRPSIPRREGSGRERGERGTSPRCCAGAAEARRWSSTGLDGGGGRSSAGRASGGCERAGKSGKGAVGECGVGGGFIGERGRGGEQARARRE